MVEIIDFWLVGFPGRPNRMRRSLSVVLTVGAATREGNMPTVAFDHGHRVSTTRSASGDPKSCHEAKRLSRFNKLDFATGVPTRSLASSSGSAPSGYAARDHLRHSFIRFSLSPGLSTLTWINISRHGAGARRAVPKGGRLSIAKRNPRQEAHL
jgi:hypothetical protein